MLWKKKKPQSLIGGSCVFPQVSTRSSLNLTAALPLTRADTRTSLSMQVPLKENLSEEEEEEEEENKKKQLWLETSGRQNWREVDLLLQNPLFFAHWWCPFGKPAGQGIDQQGHHKCF